MSVLLLFVWHKRLWQINVPFFKTFLQCLNIVFKNDLDGYICDSCQQTNVIKVYNQEP